MRVESGLEFLPVDASWFFMSINICIQPFRCGALKLVQSRQDLLLVVGLYDLELVLNCLDPAICVHWFNGMREGGRLNPLKFAQLILQLRLRSWLVALGKLHVGHHL
jgi:hypothetical protein